MPRRKGTRAAPHVGRIQKTPTPRASSAQVIPNWNSAPHHQASRSVYIPQMQHSGDMNFSAGQKASSVLTHYPSPLSSNLCGFAPVLTVHNSGTIPVNTHVRSLRSAESPHAHADNDKNLGMGIRNSSEWSIRNQDPYLAPGPLGVNHIHQQAQYQISSGQDQDDQIPEVNYFARLVKALEESPTISKLQSDFSNEKNSLDEVKTPQI